MVVQKLLGSTNFQNLNILHASMLVLKRTETTGTTADYILSQIIYVVPVMMA